MILRTNNKIMALYAILTAILCSGHAFQTIFPALGYMVIPIAGVAFIFELADKNCWRLDKLRGAILLFVIMILCTMITTLGSGAVFYVTVLSYAIAAYGICRWYSFKDFVNYYLKIMTVVTVVGVVGYILVQATSVMEMLPVIENVNDVEYHIAGIFNYITLTPERNCGMYWEPGMFATHLTVAMALEIMTKKKPNPWRMILFSAGIFTANSSAGFALWFLCVMLLLVKNANVQNVVSSIMAMIILCIGVVVVLNFDNILQQTGLIDNEYFAKLETDSVADSSRIKALEHNLKSFLSAPIFGVGIATATEQMQHVADTSTSTYLMSIFGIMGIAYTVYWAIGIFKLPKVNILAKVLLLVIVLVILNKEPHHQILMTWCLLFYLLKGDFDWSKDRKMEGNPHLCVGRKA